MKLKLVQKIELKVPVFSSVAIANNKIVIFSYIENDYTATIVSQFEIKTITIPIRKSSFFFSGLIAFAIDDTFGVVHDRNELLYYSFQEEQFKTIEIQQQEILPEIYNPEWRVSVSDTTLFPICFRGKQEVDSTRHFGLLDIDIKINKAKWVSWSSLHTEMTTDEFKNVYPPKMDSIMLQNNELFIFSPGDQSTSVLKWGMDYYEFVKTTLDGLIVETFFESGNLHALDCKKRGVNGVFDTTQKYLILTPVFQNDEWKGKQKIHHIKNNKTSEIIFPYGFGKSPQTLQIYENNFWVYLRKKEILALCTIDEE
jgi:hypothetical protein